MEFPIQQSPFDSVFPTLLTISSNLYETQIDPLPWRTNLDLSLGHLLRESLQVLSTPNWLAGTQQGLDISKSVDKYMSSVKLNGWIGRVDSKIHQKTFGVRAWRLKKWMVIWNSDIGIKLQRSFEA